MKSVVLKNVYKNYKLDSVQVPALTDVGLDVYADRLTVIAGPSGSGKSTLLNVIGCIDPPNSGSVNLGGVEVYQLSDNDLSDFRAKNIGFIFQNFNLLPVLSAYENVEYPLVLAGVATAARKQRVNQLLEAVELLPQAKNRPGQLSGGQRQRVAIARALAIKPSYVFADEPTANLDSKTGNTIIALMRQLQREEKVSFIISSHDQRVLQEADDSIFISDGKIAEIRRGAGL